VGARWWTVSPESDLRSNHFATGSKGLIRRREGWRTGTDEGPTNRDISQKKSTNFPSEGKIYKKGLGEG